MKKQYAYTHQISLHTATLPINITSKIDLDREFLFLRMKDSPNGKIYEKVLSEDDLHKKMDISDIFEALEHARINNGFEYSYGDRLASFAEEWSIKIHKGGVVEIILTTKNSKGAIREFTSEIAMVETQSLSEVHLLKMEFDIRYKKLEEQKSSLAKSYENLLAQKEDALKEKDKLIESFKQKISSKNVQIEEMCRIQKMTNKKIGKNNKKMSERESETQNEKKISQPQQRNSLWKSIVSFFRGEANRHVCMGREYFTIEENRIKCTKSKEQSDLFWTSHIVKRQGISIYKIRIIVGKKIIAFGIADLEYSRYAHTPLIQKNKLYYLGDGPDKEFHSGDIVTMTVNADPNQMEVFWQVNESSKESGKITLDKNSRTNYVPFVCCCEGATLEWIE